MTNLVTKASELIYQMDNDQINQVVEAIKLKRTHLARQMTRSILKVEAEEQYQARLLRLILRHYW